MDKNFSKLLKEIRNGGFKAGHFTIYLENGREIWTENSWLSYGFHPSNNVRFSLKQKWLLKKAIKEGKLKQLVAPKPNNRNRSFK